MEEVIHELKNANMDIVVLTETKKKGTGTETVNNYTHIFSGIPKHQRAKRGVSVMVHKKFKHKITDFETIDENIIRVNININQTPVTILGVYAISDDESIAAKDEFFEKLNDIITNIGKSRELIILGDLNSRVGQRINSEVIGPYGEINLNDNGERLIQVCQSHTLRIMNGFYKHKDIHKYTWVQHTRNLKSIIDYVIVKQSTTLKVNDVRVLRGPTCGSDHYIVRTKMVFPFKSNKDNNVNEEPQQTEVITNKRYNLNSLINESTRNLYQHRLDEKLLHNIEDQSVEQIYENITSSIKEAAEEAIGLKTNSASKKLWWNQEIEELKFVCYIHACVIIICAQDAT
ncbi:uncharacterized protein [Diabrotica undecimpunctata]|uniref:uncharacterized protein n=1 Tax=Diabrotica undecimpunctata TaxID=50387 RepID=UPI003B637AEA